MGGVISIPGWKWEGGVAKTYDARGISDRENRRVFIAADLSGTDLEQLDTIAHEIGHIIFQDGGHPDQKNGPFALSPTPKKQRLMCSGNLRVKDGSARITVKGEWDKAKQWFDQEIDADRMDQ